jgi:hypothetical protein
VVISKAVDANHNDRMRVSCFNRFEAEPLKHGCRLELQQKWRLFRRLQVLRRSPNN